MGSLASIYLLALAWGLAGGFSHCIGMCGIFVVSYTGLPDKDVATRFLHPERHLFFHVGRLFSLTALGILGGLLGSLTHLWATAQGILSLVAGIVLIGLALGFAGILPQFRIPEPDVLGAGGGKLRRLFVKTLQSQSSWKPLLIGLFVGLLPCGLTYQALIPATLTQSPWRGALIMALFGLGTVPGLLTLGLFGNALFGGLLMNLKFRNAMTKAAAFIMAIMGVAFIYRALPNL